MAVVVREATIPIVPDPSKGGSRFTGHLTVARTRRRFVDPAAQMELSRNPLVSTFDVDFFDLVKSEPASEGPKYTTLARLPVAR